MVQSSTEEFPLPSWKSEAKVIILLALPTIIQTASQQLMLTTDQIFLGHLGTLELAAAAVGLTFSNIQLFFLIGASTALDTLGAQAFGSGNHEALVTVSFTSAVVLVLLCIPLGISLCFAKAAATTIFKQSEDVARLVGLYCKGLIPGLVPMMLSIVLMKYLQVQTKVVAPAVATLLTFFINIGCNMIFIKWFGFQGSAWATSFSRLCQFIFLSIAVALFERGKAKNKAIKAKNATDEAGCANDHLQKEAGTSLQRDGFVPLVGGPSSGYVDPPKPAIWRPGKLMKSLSSKGLSPLARELSWFSGSKEKILDENGDPRVGDEDDQVDRDTERLLGDSSTSRNQALQQSGKNALSLMDRVKDALHPRILYKFAALAIPGGMMMAFEAGSFEITTILAAQLGPTVTAAHACMLAVIVLTYFACPFALGIAASIRVGNLVGAGNAKLAKLSADICIYIASIVMALAAVIIVATRNHLGKIFTDDVEVIATIASIAPMAALFQVSDGIWGTCQGILRGCGRQRELLILTLLGFWLVGITLCSVLAFPAGLGLQGIWWGISAGDTTTMLLGVVSLVRVKWEVEVEKSRDQVACLQNKEEPKSSGKLVCSDMVDKAHHVEVHVETHDGHLPPKRSFDEVELGRQASSGIRDPQ